MKTMTTAIYLLVAAFTADLVQTEVTSPGFQHPHHPLAAYAGVGVAVLPFAALTLVLMWLARRRAATAAPSPAPARASSRATW